MNEALKTEAACRRELKAFLANYHPGKRTLNLIRRRHTSARAQLGILRMVHAANTRPQRPQPN